MGPSDDSEGYMHILPQTALLRACDPVLGASEVPYLNLVFARKTDHSCTPSQTNTEWKMTCTTAARQTIVTTAHQEANEYLTISKMVYDCEQLRDLMSGSEDLRLYDALLSP